MAEMVPVGSPEWYRRLDQHTAVVRKMIDQQGFMVQAVFPKDAEQGPAFAYTVGLTAKGLPELLVAGVPHEVAAQILTEAVPPLVEGLIRAGAPWQCPEWMGPHMQVVVVPPVVGVMGGAYRLYGVESVAGLQLLWADTRGRFPFHPDYGDEPQSVL